MVKVLSFSFEQSFGRFTMLLLDFEHFQKKDDPQSWFISEITHSGKRR